MIGSDTREGLDSLQNFGESEGARGDVIMLIKLYPDGGRAQILSLPRDLLVDIPGQGTDRINAAYAFGGAPLMVRTVGQATGLPDPPLRRDRFRRLPVAGRRDRRRLHRLSLRGP